MNIVDLRVELGNGDIVELRIQYVEMLARLTLPGESAPSFHAEIYSTYQGWIHSDMNSVYTVDLSTALSDFS